jgi:hypothetical protein
LTKHKLKPHVKHGAYDSILNEYIFIYATHLEPLGLGKCFVSRNVPTRALLANTRRNIIEAACGGDEGQEQIILPTELSKTIEKLSTKI